MDLCQWIPHLHFWTEPAVPFECEAALLALHCNLFPPVSLDDLLEPEAVRWNLESQARVNIQKTNDQKGQVIGEVLPDRVHRAELHFWVGDKGLTGTLALTKHEFLHGPRGPRVVDPVVKREKAKIVGQDPIFKLELNFIFVEPIEGIGLRTPLPLFAFHVTPHNFQEPVIGVNATRVGSHPVIEYHYLHNATILYMGF